MVLVLAGTIQAFAQANQATTPPKPTPVAFDCQCSDFVGSHYATALRQLLSQSPRYQLASTAAPTNKQGKAIARNWHISVMSLDPSATNNGQYAALSIVFLKGDSNFMMQDVQYCSRATVKICARSTLATFSQFLKEIGQ